MRRLLSRTSITVDEAVSILLGRSTGPIDFEPTDESEDAVANCPTFCLRETLEDEFEVLEGAYKRAKYEKQPAHVIAEKLAALHDHKAVMEQADDYRCAIDDELAKGEQSGLRLDHALTSTAYRFITLHSFREWAESIDKDRPEVPVSDGSATRTRPRTKLLQQGEAILAEIRKQNLDPMALPPSRPGHPGVKAAVHKALRTLPLFKGSRIFDKAWQGLLDQDRMAYDKKPSSPKKLDGGDL